MPRDVVDKLNRQVNAGMEQPNVQKYLRQEAIETRHMTPDEFTDFVRSEIAKWAPMVKTAVEAE
jgi:tripartite-type tricarboxylate transporter receptor subunit TctC